MRGMQLPRPCSPVLKSAAVIRSLALTPLAPAGDEARTFRRFPMFQEAGVQLSAEHTTHRLAEVTHGRYHPVSGLCYRSVLVRDLSLTGLYFLTTLPYRVGCQVEIQLPLPRQTLHLPAIVRRRVPPSMRDAGSPEEAFGCGVDFLYSRMSQAAKQELMEFLMQRFSPASVVPNKKRADLGAWTSLRPL